jgi:hypothetical protein
MKNKTAAAADGIIVSAAAGIERRRAIDRQGRWLWPGRQQP